MSDNAKEVILNVHGMTCNGCAVAVRDTLNRLEGVESASVSLERKQAIIQMVFISENVQRVVSAINSLGYKATLEI